jgi:hypothetical protein
VLGSWQALLDYLHADMAHNSDRAGAGAVPQRKNMLIRDEAMWEGSVDESAVYVREIMRRALDCQATALIIVHNHPSGDPPPASRTSACYSPAPDDRIWAPRTASASGSRSRRMRSTRWPSSASCRGGGGGGVGADGAAIDVERIDAIEAEVKHDVIAFLTWVGRACRAGGALPAPGHDQLGRARHLPRGAARPRRRPADRGSRRAARRAEAPRVRAQADADHRPQPRHPCRAGHLRPEARPAYAEFDRCRAGWSRRARRSPPAPSPARSAPSPTSIRASRRMSRRRWGLTPSRSRPRSSRATATPCSSRRWA